MHGYASKTLTSFSGRTSSSGGDKSRGEIKVGLHPGVLERGESTKRGTARGVYILDQQVANWLACRKAEVGPKGRIFPFSYESYLGSVKEALGDHDLQDLGGTHLFRHTGAVHLIHYGFPPSPGARPVKWKTDKVQVRGRWPHAKSVAHYTKSHLLLRNEERLSESKHERGAWLLQKPGLRLGLRTIEQEFGDDWKEKIRRSPVEGFFGEFEKGDLVAEEIEEEEPTLDVSPGERSERRLAAQEEKESPQAYPELGESPFARSPNRRSTLAFATMENIYAI